MVEVVLSGKGCEGIKLAKSSGYRILDKNPLETVSKVCGKFPKPQRKINVKVPISYRLR
ncbi:MAG TPA: energy transducer TonB [Aquifex aeolicus]|nr:energy transducer TonB [Aquifex aeolicus]